MFLITDILDHALREIGEGRAIALCAVIRTQGSTPQPAGTVFTVDEAGRMRGSLGGGCIEALVRRTAHELLLRKQSGVLRYELDHDFGYDDGMICGGTIEVAVQTIDNESSSPSLSDVLAHLRAGRGATIPLQTMRDAQTEEHIVHLETTPKLVIAGAGHITRCLAPLARDLGFQVWIVDERSSYANSDRFPPPLCPVVGEIAGTLRQWHIDESTYVVIVTRGHRHDEAALSAVLHSPAKYVGMIGSQRKIQVVFDDLRHQGFRDAELSRVHAPIGLAIGAKTAEEIALSIAAELIKVRRATSHAAVDGPFAVHQSGGARDSG